MKNTLVAFTLPDATVARFAVTGTTANSYQWEERIKESLQIPSIISVDGEIQIPTISIRFDDNDDYWKGVLADATNRFLYGVAVNIYDTDGSTLLYGGKVLNWQFDTGTFTVLVGTRHDLLGTYVLDPIDNDEFPNAETDAYDQYKPLWFGATMTIRAWRVNNSGTYRYVLLGLESISVGTIDSISLVSALTPAGGDVTGSSAIVYGGDSGYYINYSATTEEYLTITATMAIVLDPGWSTRYLQASLHSPGGVDTMGVHRCIDDTDHTMHYEWRGYRDNGYSQAGYIYGNISAAEFFRKWCQSFGVEVEYAGAQTLAAFRSPVDLYVANGTTGAVTLTEDTNILSFESIATDPLQLGNRVTVSYAPSYDEGYTKRRRFNDYDSWVNWGKVQDTPEVELPFITDDHSAWITAKYRMLERSEPRTTATLITTHIEGAVGGIAAGDFIWVTHQNHQYSGAALYLVRSAIQDRQNENMILTVEDVDHWRDWRTEDRLLLHSRATDGSERFEDWAVGHTHRLTVGSGVTHITAQKPTGAVSSIDFDGTANGYIEIHDDNGYAYPDILSNTTWTIDLWARRTRTSTSEVILQATGATSGVWDLRFHSSDVLRFRWDDGGGTSGNIDSTTAINDTDWHHIVLHRDGDEYALYIDGVQEVYRNGAISGILVGDVSYALGAAVGGATGQLDGQVYEVHIATDNPLSLAPVVGLTDTYSTPGWWYHDGQR